MEFMQTPKQKTIKKGSDDMGFFSWIILGGLAGWLASMLTKNNEKMGLIKNIVVGIQAP